MGQNSGLLSSLTDWNSTLAGYADSISSGVVMPIALTVLALFMVLELYNFTQTIAMNGGSTAFTIQQVALVMLKITLCRWAVLHSTEILNAMFEVAATVTNGISGYVGSGQVNTEVNIENAISALPGGIGNMPVAMELMVVSWMLRLVNIVINTIVAARFIELYVYNALASLPIATLCYRELHGIAVNFLKNYMAVALQGAVLYLVIGFYPALTASLGSGGDITEQAWAHAGQIRYSAGGRVYERTIHQSHHQRYLMEEFTYALNKNQSRNHGISREILSRAFTASAGLLWCCCRAGHSNLLRLPAMASAGYSAGFLHCYGRSLTLSWAGLYQP